MHPVKTRISLRIHAVWSVFWSTSRRNGYAKTLIRLRKRMSGSEFSPVHTQLYRFCCVPAQFFSFSSLSHQVSFIFLFFIYKSENGFILLSFNFDFEVWSLRLKRCIMKMFSHSKWKLTTSNFNQALIIARKKNDFKRKLINFLINVTVTTSNFSALKSASPLKQTSNDCPLWLECVCVLHLWINYDIAAAAAAFV